MLKNKLPVFLVGLTAATALLSACSSNKDIPQGKRIAVLEQSSELRTEGRSDIKIQVPAVSAVNTWYQRGYNAQHVTPNIRVGTDFTKQWKADFGKGSSKREFLISQPLVNQNTVYTLDAGGLLRAFKLQDGETVWATELKSQNKYVRDTSMKGVGIAMDGQNIYAVTGYGVVFAVRAKDGAVQWEKDLQIPLRTAPVLANGKLFIQSSENKFWSLDRRSGEILWDYDIALENTTMVGGAPAAYCADLDIIVAGFSNGELQAFNASLGSALWSDMLIANRQAYSSTFLHTIQAAPVVEGERVYALGNSDVLTAIDVRTGTRLWEREIGGSQTPLLSGNVLYVVSDKNHLVAVAKDSGAVLWTTPIEHEGKASDVTVFAPIMLDGRLIVALSNGQVLSFDPRSGRQINAINLKEKLNSAPIAANGYILFTTSNAKLIAYK